jgi:hypothetical protein
MRLRLRRIVFNKEKKRKKKNIYCIVGKVHPHLTVLMSRAIRRTILNKNFILRVWIRSQEQWPSGDKNLVAYEENVLSSTTWQHLFPCEGLYIPHSWTILEGENPRILQKIRSPVFQCSRVHDVGRTLVVFPNKSEAFKLTMNAGLWRLYSIGTWKATTLGGTYHPTHITPEAASLSLKTSFQVVSEC